MLDLKNILNLDSEFTITKFISQLETQVGFTSFLRRGGGNFAKDTANRLLDGDDHNIFH
ncbi:hypothetical protein [Xenorhabdus santafensis]|uniref:hypothetical protein n=1 Tax=Xenorhabdus santafensis TaxID=2582833 RepID=UPI0029E7D9BA|nr:hypothetical protein [Xenorhabdus sp. 12]